MNFTKFDEALQNLLKLFIIIIVLPFSFQTFSTMDLSWRPPPPAKVGDPESTIDTPALILDMKAAEANLAKLPKIMEAWPNVSVRVHVKAHKTPALAKLQVSNVITSFKCDVSYPNSQISNDFRIFIYLSVTLAPSGLIANPPVCRVGTIPTSREVGKYFVFSHFILV